MLRNWIHFFVGTPQRFIAWMGALAVAWGVFHPAAVQHAIGAFVGAVVSGIAPSAYPLLGLGIAIFALLVILKGIKSAFKDILGLGTKKKRR